MPVFDLNNSPLSGTVLIEASAGTGKTYTVAGLYVRLVLEENLRVEQILVVTYTKAATEELKVRIRDKLQKTRQGIITGASDDAFVTDLLRKIHDLETAFSRIDGALVDFDKAAIWTIHGFCQRLLHENAFETGTLFETELVADPAIYYQEVAEDFWRRHLYGAPPEFIGFLIHVQKIDGPAFFYRMLRNLNIPNLVVIPQVVAPPLSQLDSFRRLRRQAAEEWRQSRRIVSDLLTDPALNSKLYGSLKPLSTPPDFTLRDIKVSTLATEMEQFVHPETAGFPLFDGFEKWTAAYLQQATKKGCIAPHHPFFRLCERLLSTAEVLRAELDRYWLYLKTAFYPFARATLSEVKLRNSVKFYDDLLLSVRGALEDQHHGRRLVNAVRRRYKAALVDEFQDTDTVQYAVFSRLFAAENASLFMIGDPKQSIYSFRGADVFSYLEAASRAETKYNLHANWRSSAGLIRAVNTLFADVEKPFLFPEITFEKGRAGGADTLEAKTFPEPALHLWFLSPEGVKPLAKTEAVTLIADAVGDEIVRLLISGKKTLQPEAIAVLVRTNRQARMVKQCLSARQVPSVLFGAGSVFDSREADELLRVITGIFEFAREERFRAALVTDLLGVRAAELDPDAGNQQLIEERRMRFREYFEEWNRSGFMPMFRWLMVREEVRARLLGYADGDRRLTNLLHLTEILHQQEEQSALAMNGLIRWLSDQCRSKSLRPEEHQLRLESDARAVRIVTIHGSKGLEYPVVFCPFGWEGSLIRDDQDIIFHARDSQRYRALDMGSDQREAHIRAAQTENLAENLRLLYVAVTRAQSRCYLVWGHIRGSETSAPAYLFHRPKCGPEQDVVACLQHWVSGLTAEERYADLASLAERSGGSIGLSKMIAAQTACLPPPTDGPVSMSCRSFSGTIDSSWKVTSYSHLVFRRRKDVDLPDRDDRPKSPPVDDLGRLTDAQTATAGRTIFDFPKGVRAGLFFHELFERLDFADLRPEYRERLVREILWSHGLEEAWTQTVAETVKRVLSMPLSGGETSLTLGSLGPWQRINEMAFYFPIHPITPRRLGDIFDGAAEKNIPSVFPLHMERLSFAPSSGFLKGYIDMVFEHSGRFYLLDWKTNHLGSSIEDYRDNGLQAAMTVDYYRLQYCLYTLALNRYLQMRHPDYDYDRHFGGVFYLFIRGINPARDPQCGVYFDRPDRGFIDRLDRSLISERTVDKHP